jgi:hypothetical protein
MTRSENMRRLWADPAFRERQRLGASAHMMALNARQWDDPVHRAAAKQRTRRQMLKASSARIEAAQLSDRSPCETSVAYETAGLIGVP